MTKLILVSSTVCILLTIEQTCFEHVCRLCLCVYACHMSLSWFLTSMACDRCLECKRQGTQARAHARRQCVLFCRHRHGSSEEKTTCWQVSMVTGTAVNWNKWRRDEVRYRSERCKEMKRELDRKITAEK